MLDEHHEIHDEVTFYPAAKADLNNALARVCIHCPYVTLRQVDRLTPELAGIVRRGGCLCIFAQEPPDWHLRDQQSLPRLKAFEGAIEVLESMGAHINLRKRIHEKLMIIDDHILWEGSLNILSHYDTSERMTRWLSRKKVAEAIAKYKLDTCEKCLALPGVSLLNQEQRSPIARAAFLGRCIQRRRLSAGLTQRDLAEKACVSQRVVSDIELGKRNVKLFTLVQICDPLGLEITAVLRSFLPAISQSLQSPTQ